MSNTIPNFIYGTAWKEDQTRDLVRTAVTAGFRAIDTANQRRHYFEEAVGKALGALYNEGLVNRSDLFLQSKYTYAQGQDNRLPYKDSDPYELQVYSSFASSLLHLHTDYLDSFILHGLFKAYRLSDEDKIVWRTMENLVADGKVKHLGISNCNLVQLQELCAQAKVKPRFVQNRCFASSYWDREVRAFCNQNGMVYQGFSLLTANQLELTKPGLVKMARGLNKTIPQVIFRFCQQKAMVPLTGTSSLTHMQHDLAIADFFLSQEDLSLIENISMCE